MKPLFIVLQHLLPQHLLSRVAGALADCETPWLKNLLIRSFIRAYDVDMSQAQHPDPEHYRCFNHFFTRALKADARPLPETRDAIVSPADGFISAIGDIHADTLFQAKDHDYSLQALLGGDKERAAPFRNGSFLTVYLSPRDYHRVHIPQAGTLREMIYLPGKLYSVNQTTVDHIPGLFARNERAACLFDTETGPMAVVLVGAMIVGSIETVWAGQVAPAPHGMQVNDYRREAPEVHLEKGLELGRFRLGSTVIVLFGPGMASWNDDVGAGTPVRMGQQLGMLL